MYPFRTKFHDYHTNRSKGPCDVFDPWVRWERGQVGIWEFVRRRRRRRRWRRRLEIWEPGNLWIWRSGNLEIWGSGNPEIWRSGDLEIQKLEFQTIKKRNSKFKSVLPKMSARSGLVGKKPPGPIWCHFRQFSIVRKNRKPYIFLLPLFLGGSMGPVPLVWALSTWRI